MSAVTSSQFYCSLCDDGLRTYRVRLPSARRTLHLCASVAQLVASHMAETLPIHGAMDECLLVRVKPLRRNGLPKSLMLPLDGSLPSAERTSARVWRIILQGYRVCDYTQRYDQEVSYLLEVSLLRRVQRHV